MHIVPDKRPTQQRHSSASQQIAMSLILNCLVHEIHYIEKGSSAMYEFTRIKIYVLFIFSPLKALLLITSYFRNL